MAEKITDIVIEEIENMAYGFVFTASDFPVDVTKQKSVNKVLENLTKAGKIRRLSNGHYFKPQITELNLATTVAKLQYDYNQPIEVAPDSATAVAELETDVNKSTAIDTNSATTVAELQTMYMN